MRGSVAHQVLYKFYSGLPKELGSDRVEPDRVEDALAFLRRCLDDAVDGVRMELTELQQRELRHGLWRDLEAFVREEAAADLPLVPRRFEVSFGSERCRAGAAARARARGRHHALREDRPHRRRPVQRARDRPGLQGGQARPLGGADRVGEAAADPAVHARAPRPRRGRAAGRPLPAAVRRAEGARAAPRERARGRRARLRENDYLDEDDVLGPGRPRARARGRHRRADPRRRRPPRPEGRRLPDVVRALVRCAG